MKRTLNGKRIDPVGHFWERFGQKEREWSIRWESEDGGALDELSTALRDVDDNLVCEVGERGEDGKRTLVLSADGALGSFDSVIDLYEAAPALNYWNVIPFRPRIDSEEGVRISMEGLKLEYDDIYFGFESEGETLDLTVHIRNFDAEDVRFVRAYCILLDTLIGEFDAAMRIGETKFERLDEAAAQRLRPLIELRELVDALE